MAIQNRPQSTIMIGGEYQVVEKLAEGGMGAVWKARTTSRKVSKQGNSSDVVIKTIKPSYVNINEMPDKKTLDHFEKVRERFMIEAKRHAELLHEGVVFVYDYGEEIKVLPNGTQVKTPYMVQEFVANKLPNKEIFEKFTLDEKLEVLEQGLRALKYLKDNKIIHRDIKPDNIFVTKDPAGKIRVKIGDFGLVKDLESKMESMTKTNTAIGTPQWMAPEQCMDAKHVDEQADIYGLFAAFRYYLIGEGPFEKEMQQMDLNTFVFRKGSGILNPAKHPLIEKDRELSALIVRGMATNPYKPSVSRKGQKESKIIPRYTVEEAIREVRTYRLMQRAAMQNQKYNQTLSPETLELCADIFQGKAQPLADEFKGDFWKEKGTFGGEDIAALVQQQVKQELSKTSVRRTERRERIERAKSTPWYQKPATWIAGGAAALLLGIGIYAMSGSPKQIEQPVKQDPVVQQQPIVQSQSVVQPVQPIQPVGQQPIAKQADSDLVVKIRDYANKAGFKDVIVLNFDKNSGTNENKKNIETYLRLSNTEIEKDTGNLRVHGNGYVQLSQLGGKWYIGLNVLHPVPSDIGLANNQFLDARLSSLSIPSLYYTVRFQKDGYKLGKNNGNQVFLSDLVNYKHQFNTDDGTYHNVILMHDLNPEDGKDTISSWFNNSWAFSEQIPDLEKGAVVAISPTSKKQEEYVDITQIVLTGLKP